MKRGRKVAGVLLQKSRNSNWLLPVVFLFLTVAIAVSGYLYYQKQKKAVINEQIAQLKAIADLKAVQIRDWLRERISDAHLIGQNPIMVAELAAFLGDRSRESRKNAIQRWMESMQRNYHYENVLLLDRLGEPVLAASQQYAIIGSEGLKTLDAARRRRDTVLSDLHSAPHVPHIHMDTVTPLVIENEIAGFVFLRIDPADFLYPMIQFWPTPSPSAETLLVKRQGEEVVFLNELRHRQGSALTLRLPLHDVDLPAALAILGKTGITAGYDYRGVAVHSVSRSIPDTPWFIVSKIDREEILQPVRRSAQVIFLVALLLILAATLTLLFFWQRQKTRYHLHLLELRQESEDKFKQVFETANVGKSITLLSGEINVNKAFCDMLGYSPEELGRIKWQDLTPTDEIEAIQKMLEPLLQGRQDAARFTKRYIHKNGSIIWGDVSVTLRRDPAGKPLHFITTVVDISERKQVEKTLREIIDNAPFGAHLYELQPEERLVLVGANQAADSILGVDNRQFIGKTIEEAFPPLRHTDIPDAYRRAAAHGVRFDTEQVEFAEGGIRGAFEVHAFQTSPNRMATFFFDITERKRAEEKLLEQHALLRIAGDMAKLGGWNVNLKENRSFWSDEVAAIHEMPPGYSPLVEEGINFYAPEWRERITKVFSACAQKGIPYDEEMEIVTATGKRLWVHTIGEAVSDEKGMIFKVQGAFQDITARKQAENEIRNLNDELEQRVLQRTAQLEVANKELEAFSYSVSHDLRAPLRAIDGFSRIVVEEYASKLDNEGRRLLGVITANTGKMAHLIDDLLAFSRLSRQKMSSTPVNLTAMANVVFSELKNLEKGRHIEFKVNALPAAAGDHSMLQLVLQNLLANAVKFTRTRNPARIELGGRSEKMENVYFIKDNGVGFDMEYVDKLFGVFQRLHGADEFEGTGVGLAIVQRIVVRHGGRVWAESEGGKGATFYFSLPTDQGLGSRG